MKQFNLLIILSLLSFTSTSQNEFGFDLYSKLESKKNLFFSPTSIKTAFAMAYEGANTSTQAEFEKVFGFEEKNDKFLVQIEQLKGTAEISNSIWILENFKVLPSYTSKLASSFQSKAYYTDFWNNPQGSADKINAWIEVSTKGMIKEMLDAASIKEFKLALVNAIYFKQDWKYPFDTAQSRKRKFKNSDGTEKEVDMMHSVTNHRFYQGDDEQVIELPYGDNKTSMVVILPSVMEKYELTDASYSELIPRLRSQSVDLDFPKFTFEMPTFELKPMLQQLGMIEAFEDTADFSGMRTERDLKIGTALHTAKIIVNEKGTEAAAVTVIGMIETESISDRPRVIKMTIDKPFYYFIKDNETGTILFMGRMNEMSPSE